MAEKLKFLLTIDMQKDFVDGVLGTHEARTILPNVARKVEECRANGYILIFTKDTHGKDYFDTREGRCLPIAHCIKGTDGHNICDEIKVDKSKDYILLKDDFGCYNAIRDVICVEALPKGVNGEDIVIEIQGVCTDICVVSNVIPLRQIFPNSEIIVHKDLCAGTTPEAHKAALKVFESCQIKVV